MVDWKREIAAPNMATRDKELDTNGVEISVYILGPTIA